MRTKIATFLAALAAGLIVAALLNPPPKNPPVSPEKSIESAMDVPTPVRDILKRSCYDCHSYQTQWPWYSSLPPLAGMIRSDVTRARSMLNFSEWTAGAGKTPARATGMLVAACAAVQQGIMPKKEYLYLHPSARLSPEEIETFCSWTREQVAELRSARAAE